MCILCTSPKSIFPCNNSVQCTHVNNIACMLLLFTLPFHLRPNAEINLVLNFVEIFNPHTFLLHP